MAILKGKIKITLLAKGVKPIASFAKGSIVIWSAVKSCFGAGFWRNDKQYDNDEGWRN